MKTIPTLFVFAGLLSSQVPNPTQRGVTGQNPSGVPVYRVEVVARTAKAVNYRHHGAKTACKGCGGCVPVCPSDAIDLQGYTDAQIRAMIDGMLEVVCS